MRSRWRAAAIAFCFLTLATVAAPGLLYVSDMGPSGNGSIDTVSSNGKVSPYANSYHFSSPVSLALDSIGNLYVSGGGEFGSIVKVTPAGTVNTFANGITFPNGIAFGSNNNLYVAEGANGSIDEYTPSGQVSTFATGLSTLPSRWPLTAEATSS